MLHQPSHEPLARRQQILKHKPIERYGRSVNVARHALQHVEDDEGQRHQAAFDAFERERFAVEMHADSDGDGVDAEAFEVHVKSVTQNE